MTLIVPQELVAPLTDAARLRGTTPEELALEGVRSILPQGEGESSLLTALGKYVGIVAGSGESLSSDCGRKFAEGLAAGKAARP